MKILRPMTGKGSLPIGVGYLYATLADSFDMSDVDVSDMTELGFIKDKAVFKRTHESKDIETANYGVVDTYNYKYTTTFDTGIISYDAHNVAQFMTGDTYVAGTAANGKVTNKTFFVEGAQPPTIALVYVGKDLDTNEEIKIIMPKCKWVGEYTLDFNNDNPIELNYSFKCFNTTLSNGQTGAAWLEETVNA